MKMSCRNLRCRQVYNIPYFQFQVWVLYFAAVDIVQYLYNCCFLVLFCAFVLLFMYISPSLSVTQ